jgi:hypothetical protein
VGAELTLGGNKATANNPRTGYFGALASGAWDINDTFGINGAVGFTHDNGTTNSDTTTPGSNIWLFQLAGDALLSDHFMLSAGLSASPANVGQSATTIDVPLTRLHRTVSIPATIHTTSSSLGALLMAVYATHGDSKWEHGIDLSAQLSRFGVTEKVTVNALQQGATQAEVDSFCANNQHLDACRVRLQPQNASLFQAKLSLAYIATLFTDNDLGLEFSYYFYDHDPTETGFYSVAVLGRTISLGDTPNAIAPVQWALKPSYVHRFGDRVMLKVWAQYGQYVPGQGYDTAAGAKVEVKLSKHWKLYLLGQGQRDVDANNTAVGSGSGIFGATWTF